MICQGLTKNNYCPTIQNTIHNPFLYCGLCRAKDKVIKHKEINRKNQCSYGEYKKEPFTACKTCGSPKLVICSNPKIIGKKRNGKLCNSKHCKHFKILT